MNQSSLIARQPICSQSLKVVGFELLYRMNNGENAAHIVDEDAATIDVLLAAYNNLSINDVVGNQMAFVNFSGNLLQQKLPPIPPKQLVIELLEDQAVTPELIRSLKQLRHKGYKIALDDFCLNEETITLVDCADIIKLDVMEHPPQSWANYIPNLTDRGITMLAEKVETYDIYEECCELGFKLFQGYFFAKPKIISGKKMSSNELSVIKLINKLNSPEVNYDEVVGLISADVDLSYNLLRTVNSGMYGLSTKVDSVRQASVILGLDHLRNWINFLALSSLDNKPQVLLDMAMVRARMCELVGQKLTKCENPEGFFTTGLFSTLDAFFDVPMNDLLDKLSLKEELNCALLKHEGILGHVLHAVIQHQQGKLCNKSILDRYRITNQDITGLYLESVQWLEANRL